MSETGAPPRILLVIAAVLVTAAAVTVAVLGMVLSGDEAGDAPDVDEPGPLPLVSIPAPDADSPQCAALVDAAPRTLESAGEQLDHRELAEPAPPSALAWGQDNPVVLRCGLQTPPELTPTSELRQINGVQWLPVPDQGVSTWFAVDREIVVALTIPDNAGTGPLQDLSDTVSETVPAAPIQFE